MKLLRRAAALLCIGLLTLTLSGPVLAQDPDGASSDPTIIEVILTWIVDALTGDDPEPDGGSLQVPPGSP